MNNDLLQQVKENTWLFTDEEIIAEYNKMQNYDLLYEHWKQSPNYITLYLYETKPITKEMYTTEVMNYLYKKSLDSKDEIDRIINKNLKWFYQYYEDALEDNDYYHAVKYARNNMISLLHY